MTQADKKKTRRLPAGVRVGIPPRRLAFSRMEKSRRYFYADNATVTTFLAVLSSVFPPGERFFMDAVRHYRKQITDPDLKAAVAGFMGQEAVHGQEHERLNRLLQERGFSTRVPDRAVRLALFGLRQLSPSMQLACTAFMEHFTASLGEVLLTDATFTREFDAEMLDIWQWHSLEEIEHKAVAFDVYEVAGNRLRERQYAPYIVVATVGPALLASWAWMLLREGKLTDVQDVKTGMTAIFGKRGFVTRIIPRMPIFSARRFHPNKHDTRELEARWRELLFGEKGRLNYAWENEQAKQMANV